MAQMTKLDSTSLNEHFVRRVYNLAAKHEREMARNLRSSGQLHLVQLQFDPSSCEFGASFVEHQNLDHELQLTDAERDHLSWHWRAPPCIGQQILDEATYVRKCATISNSKACRRILAVIRTSNLGTKINFAYAAAS
jgi:hypothetical protein